jgi:hypothetical protein
MSLFQRLQAQLQNQIGPGRIADDLVTPQIKPVSKDAQCTKCFRIDEILASV